MEIHFGTFQNRAHDLESHEDPKRMQDVEVYTKSGAILDSSRVLTPWTESFGAVGLLSKPLALGSIAKRIGAA
jgi:hypothetical protein